MQAFHPEPLDPSREGDEATLTRLSASIATLTGLLDDARGRGRIYLAGLFAHARATQVAQARVVVVRVRGLAVPRTIDAGPDLALPPITEVRPGPRLPDEDRPRAVQPA